MGYLQPKTARRSASSMLGLALLGFVPLTAPVGAAHAASFDCDSKTLLPDEKLICDTRSLNDADVKMATTFELLTGLMAMGSRGTLQDEQTAWLKRRQACGADAACLKTSYDERQKQLETSAKTLPKPL